MKRIQAGNFLFTLIQVLIRIDLLSLDQIDISFFFLFQFCLFDSEDISLEGLQQELEECESDEVNYLQI